MYSAESGVLEEESWETFTPSEPSEPFEPSGPSEPSGTSGTFTPSEPSEPFEPSGPCGTFSDGSKPKKPVLSTELRRMYRLCRRRVFSSLVASKQGVAPHTWSCCAQSFHFLAAVHQHVSRMHGAELQQQAEAMLHQLLQHQQDHGQNHGGEPEPEQVVCAWLPDISHLTQEQLQSPPGKVLLFYHYCHLDNPQEVCAWQRALCERLQLTGKVRVATEGLNGSVGGSVEAAALYVRTMMSHPTFRAMEEQDFKSSEGGAECFPDLKVKVHQEIVPMGIPPDVLSFQQAGPHLDPECFHQEVQDFLSGESRDTLLLDCRNFYESRIGRFQRSLAPDIRKFSYFPDYVDQNLDLFRDKKVLMYCTGGVRCERASAYLRSKGVCREVFQLGGGILCYLQRFPHGFYRGKLFVFDERYALCWNQDVIAGRTRVWMTQREHGSGSHFEELKV